MQKLIIDGKKILSGSINISGSKNREHKKLKKDIDSIIKKACVLHKKPFNDTKKMIN